MTLFIAMILDAIFGEPKAVWDRVPHPAVLMGRAVGWCDENLNAGSALREKGIASLVALSLGAMLLGLILAAIPGRFVDVIVLAVLIAQRSLSDHVRAVARGLRANLRAGRIAVADIVGRDTAQMDEADVARAAIESAAENLSDGVIAPIFWYLVLGLPGLLLYKIVNTADSMIGYRTPRHERFGWAAARFDDLLNFIPARLTAGLVMLAAFRFDIFDDILEEAPQHRSPNAGWPEAAFAYALNFALSGPRRYDGELRDYPFVNANGIRDLAAEHVDEAVVLMWKVWLIPLVLAGLVTFLL